MLHDLVSCGRHAVRSKLVEYTTSTFSLFCLSKLDAYPISVLIVPMTSLMFILGLCRRIVRCSASDEIN